MSQRKKARLDPLPNGSNVGANGSVNMPPSSLIGNTYWIYLENKSTLDYVELLETMKYEYRVFIITFINNKEIQAE